LNAYILIIYMFASNRATTIVAEFNDKPSCEAAAQEFMRQKQSRPDVIMCARKGATN
jgi:hypothetical protein